MNREGTGCQNNYLVWTSRKPSMSKQWRRVIFMIILFFQMFCFRNNAFFTFQETASTPWCRCVLKQPSTCGLVMGNLPLKISMLGTLNEHRETSRTWSNAAPCKSVQLGNTPLPIDLSILAYCHTAEPVTAQLVCVSDWPAIIYFSFPSASSAHRLLPCW